MDGRCVIAFDGDDTLWHNETIFSMTHERFGQLLEPYQPAEVVMARLVEAERANLALFGYGIKGFALSMVETAIDVTEGRVTAAEIATILDYAKEMLVHPTELLDGVEEAVDAVAAAGHRLMVITKGDLFDQESKLARSGLVERFEAVEILSEKDEAAYRRVLRRHGVDPAQFVMVGNSLRSDILPVLAIGGHAVYVPYHITWHHEQVELDPDADHGFVEIPSLAALPQTLSTLLH